MAPTSSEPEALVWAVDADRAPDCWFPRNCPRALAWATDTTTAAGRLAILGPSVERVHAIEYGLTRLQKVRLYAYALDAADFEPYADDPTSHAHVARTTVRPLGPPEPVGDLVDRHERAGIELRLVSNLWPWWDAVIASTAGFSGIRLPERSTALTSGSHPRCFHRSGIPVPPVGPPLARLPPAPPRSP